MSKQPSVKAANKAIQLLAVQHDDISNYRAPKPKRGPRHQKKKK